ncbi:MAG: poly-gamma-glutamate system protein [Candidatus Aminicenantes bacterium]|nr:poly-gamma-glutamate system protein [Candidatus Aminicenantes bacterium]
MSASVRPLYFLAAWSLLFGLVLWLFPPAESAGADPEITRAVSLMHRSVEAIRRYRDENGPAIDARFDLNRTGLVGMETSPITTSLGHLEAKRTTTNPQFAGAVVRMFREAGLKPGDRVAVGASGSFPGLILAALCAAEAMDLHPLVISSLGASNWGGNHPEWTWHEMSVCLRQAGVLDIEPLAFSLGGDGDFGADMTAEGRDILERKILASGRPFLRPKDLPSGVAARLAHFGEAAGGGQVQAFVNIGGSFIDMGTDGEILKLRPGYNPAADVVIPPVERRGLIQEMARQGVPVIHLLYVKGLCDRYGLPWDPVPLPDPDASDSLPGLSPRPTVLIVYLAGMIFGLAWIARTNSRFGKKFPETE